VPGLTTRRAQIVLRTWTQSEIGSSNVHIANCGFTLWCTMSSPNSKHIMRRWKRMRSNKSFERTVNHRGRAALAVDGVLAGAEWALCPAAQFNR